MLPSAPFFLALGMGLVLAALTYRYPLRFLVRRRLLQGWTPAQVQKMSVAWTILAFGSVSALVPSFPILVLLISAATSLVLAFRVSRRASAEVAIWVLAAVVIDLSARTWLIDAGWSF